MLIELNIWMTTRSNCLVRNTYNRHLKIVDNLVHLRREVDLGCNQNFLVTNKI